MPEGANNPFRSPGDPSRYNNSAIEVMKQHGVRVNDLLAVVQPRLAELQLPGNVHFTGKGSQFLAEQVVAALTAELPAQPSAVAAPSSR